MCIPALNNDCLIAPELLLCFKIDWLWGLIVEPVGGGGCLCVIIVSSHRCGKQQWWNGIPYIQQHSTPKSHFNQFVDFNFHFERKNVFAQVVLSTSVSDAFWNCLFYCALLSGSKTEHHSIQCNIEPCSLVIFLHRLTSKLALLLSFTVLRYWVAFIVFLMAIWIIVVVVYIHKTGYENHGLFINKTCCWVIITKPLWPDLPTYLIFF